MIKESQVDTKSNNLCPSFSIVKYLISLILPKCTLIKGEAITSVYLQIALNINHKKVTKKWMEKKSWIGVKTISKITGYNERTINNVIKDLIELDLIQKSYHGKLKMFSLKNHELEEVVDIHDFIKNIEDKLLRLSKKDDKILKEKFKFINSYYTLSSSNSKMLTKRIWFDNINEVREIITKAESVYKGSSLFCINLFWENSIQNLNKRSISEVDRSKLLGCSQSTLNRYIQSYKESGLIDQIKDENCRINNLQFNTQEQILEKINLEQVVNKMDNDTKLICPICNTEFSTPRSLSMHITKMQDDEHQKLITLKKENNFSATQLINYLKTNNGENTGIDIKVQTDNYMSIPCECTINCNECFKDWKKAFYDECSHERKQAYIEEYNVGKEVKVKTPKKKKEETGFEKVPTLKKNSEDTAPSLVKFFYTITGGVSPNWGKESKQIKNLLSKISPDEIRIVLSYMARRNQIDLRFLSNSVNDALLEQRYINELDVEGTAASLLKRFYNGHNLEINKQTMVREISRIQETLNSGLSYEDTKYVIDYMISTKCSVINFLASKITEAMASKNNTNIISNATSNKSIKNNPSFYDQGDLIFIKNELAGGRKKLRDVEPKYYEEAKEISRQILINRKFDQKFNAFEWILRVGLELDFSTYQSACNDINKETYLDFLMKNSSRIDPQKLDKIKKAKEKYENWLNKQHEIFSKYSQNS